MVLEENILERESRDGGVVVDRRGAEKWGACCPVSRKASRAKAYVRRRFFPRATCEHAQPLDGAGRGRGRARGGYCVLCLACSSNNALAPHHTVPLLRTVDIIALAAHRCPSPPSHFPPSSQERGHRASLSFPCWPPSSPFRTKSLFPVSHPTHLPVRR